MVFNSKKQKDKQTKKAPTPRLALDDDSGTCYSKDASLIPDAHSVSASTALCCGRFRTELKQSAFAAVEVTGQRLHGPNTFAPWGEMTVLFKTICMSWSVSLFVTGLFGSEPPVAFFFAYLTNCTLLVASMYLLLSWWNSLTRTIFVRLNLGNTDSYTSNTNIGLLHNLSWGLFAVAAPSEIVVTVGYWGMDWDGTMDTALDYRNIMVHGGVMLLVMVEGLLVNRIPLRARHYGLLMLYLFGYLIWTLIHAFYMIGDPTSEDDDAIYEGVLEWNNDPWLTAGFAALFLFGLAPLSFLVVYAMSLYSFPCGCRGASRRYVTAADTNSSSYNTDNDSVLQPSLYRQTLSSSSYMEMGRLQKKRDQQQRQEKQTQIKLQHAKRTGAALAWFGHSEK